MKTPEQWDKEGVCFASVAKKIQDDALQTMSTPEGDKPREHLPDDMKRNFRQRRQGGVWVEEATPDLEKLARETLEKLVLRPCKQEYELLLAALQRAVAEAEEANAFSLSPAMVQERNDQLAQALFSARLVEDGLTAQLAAEREISDGLGRLNDKLTAKLAEKDERWQHFQEMAKAHGCNSLTDAFAQLAAAKELLRQAESFCDGAWGGGHVASEIAAFLADNKKQEGTNT